MASLTLEEKPFSRPKIYSQPVTGKKWTKNIVKVALKNLSRNLIYTSQYQFFMYFAVMGISFLYKYK